MHLIFRVLLAFAAASTLISAQAELTVIEQSLWNESNEGSADKAAGEGAIDRSRESHQRGNINAEDLKLTIYKPSHPTGAACMVFPGGGYARLSIEKEGHFVAKWLAERGIVGVVASYRCGGGANQHPVPLSDAQRAMRVIRSQAATHQIDPQKIGVIGFSAGGHLAASVATHSGDRLEGVSDSLVEVSARPDFAVLVYPVISMKQDITHGGSRKNLLGTEPSEALVTLLSADEQVDANTPPTLLIHSINDKAVPVANTQRYYDACLKHNVPVEVHLYETGGHGYGMWGKEGTFTGWPTVLENWLAGQLLIPND